MLDYAEHALGVLSLLVFAGAGGLSVYGMFVTIAPNVGRIVDALSGRPVTPAASATPHVASTPSRRGVEAAAAPAIRTRGAL